VNDDPDNPAALNDLGMALARSGEPREAVEGLRRAVERTQRDDRDAARRWVDEALRRDPGLTEAVALRAQLEAP
jgi:Tfp pilus assembly protein PilF